MSTSSSLTGLEVRPYRDTDETGVLELLDAALSRSPGERTRRYFRWKHLDNPFGRSVMLVAEAGGRIVGFRAFMRWRFEASGTVVAAARAVDTATHPDHQRRGVFTRLTEAALPLVADEADLIFNTPNHRSLPGYLKLGWQVVHHVPVLVRVCRPGRVAVQARSLRAAPHATRPGPLPGAAPASDVLADDGLAAGLLDRVRERQPRLATPRDAAYLRWRYGEASGLGYRAVVEGGGADPAGLAIFRVRLRGRLWEATVSEVLVPPGDTATARRLLRAVARAARADHLSCSFPGLAPAFRAAVLSGYVPVPAGPVLVVKTLRDGVEPDPCERRAWGLALGDVEVF